MQRLQVTIATLQVKRAEAAKGTQHGLEFESGVGALICSELEPAGDIVAESGSTAGITPSCKVGAT